MKTFFFIFAAWIPVQFSFAQVADSSASTGDLKKKKFGANPEAEFYQTQPDIYVDDSLITVYLDVVKIVNLDLRTFEKKSDQKKYDRLVSQVKKAYPFAKIAGEKYRYYEEMTEDKSTRKKKAIIKEVEGELWDEYGDKLKKLTIGQGRIFLKLINRETGFTSYEVIKDWRGGLTAWGYNALASIANINLKTGYDPDSEEEDRYIEEIVQMIDQGRIPLE